MKNRFFLGSAIILASLLSPSGTAAQSLAPAHSASQTHFYNMEYDEAIRILKIHLENHPRDLRALNYLATALLYREMNRWGILEKLLLGQTRAVTEGKRPLMAASFKEEFLSAIEAVQQTCHQRLARDPEDKTARYWLGVGRSTLGTYRYALAKSYLGALKEAKASRKIHEELFAEDPGLIDAELIPGVHEYIQGSLPWIVKVMGSLVGISGNKKKGLRMVEQVSRKGDLAHRDAQFVLVLLYLREKRYQDRLAVLKELSHTYPRNYLLVLGLADTHEGLGNPQEALAAYQKLLDRSSDHSTLSQPFPITRAGYQAGSLHEKLGQPEKALSVYEAAFNGKKEMDVYALRAGLAAAKIYEKRNQPQDAIQIYQQIREARPQSKEGKMARRALKKLGRL